MFIVAETEHKGKGKEKMEGWTDRLVRWVGRLVDIVKLDWIILMVWKTFQISKYPLKIILSCWFIMWLSSIMDGNLVILQIYIL